MDNEKAKKVYESYKETETLTCELEELVDEKKRLKMILTDKNFGLMDKEHMITSIFNKYKLYDVFMEAFDKAMTDKIDEKRKELEAVKAKLDEM